MHKHVNTSSDGLLKMFYRNDVMTLMTSLSGTDSHTPPAHFTTLWARPDKGGVLFSGGPQIGFDLLRTSTQDQETCSKRCMGYERIKFTSRLKHKVLQLRQTKVF